MTSSEKNLLQYNTMRMDANCLGILKVHSTQYVFEALANGIAPLKIIGGGSNILITGDLDSYVLKNEIKGIEIIDEDDRDVLVKVGAGENWHQFVMWSISHGLYGVENLALIPGCVGAAPMQNIGAYGVEQDQIFHSLQAIDLEHGTTKTFFKEECKFGYRESIFKNEVKDQYLITHVTYLLSKSGSVNTRYGAIDQKLNELRIQNPTPKDVAKAVISIRQSKLPDPEELPNTGSFFKNPIVPNSEIDRLKSRFADIPTYKVNESTQKIPAAWLIQNAGYKGAREGDAATHINHALVLVNHGSASGLEMIDFAMKIKAAVQAQFAIEIMPEVNIW